MTAAVRVDRRRVLSYRVRAQGLDRAAAGLADLAVLDLGVQETTGSSARLALSARLPAPVVDDPTADGSHVLLWSLRGSPHLHRAADVADVAAALWPVDDRDAAARLGDHGRTALRAGVPVRAALDDAAAAVRGIVAAPTGKAELSGALTRRVVPEFSRDCRPCGCVHVSDLVLRLAALGAGVRLEPGTSPPVAVALAGWPAVPPLPGGLDRLVLAYLRGHGPAGPSDAAGSLGLRPADVRAAWPAGLAEVDVDGRRASLPEDLVDGLVDGPPAAGVRLLPPSDPWLQSRDRDLVVPDAARRTEVWKVIGSPGVVLVDGEVTGVWRPTASGRRLTLQLTPWRAFSAAERAEVEQEAAVVAAVRGLALRACEWRAGPGPG